MNTKNRRHKKEYVASHISDKQLKIASVLGFVLGIFGVHDFVVGRKSGGIIHILICATVGIMTPFCFFLGAMASDAGYHNMSVESRLLAYAIFYTPLVIIIASYIWAMVESVNFLGIARLRIDTLMLPMAQKEAMKRRYLDYMMIAIAIATVIVIPIVVAFLTMTISIINYR